MRLGCLYCAMKYFCYKSFVLPMHPSLSALGVRKESAQGWPASILCLYREGKIPRACGWRSAGGTGGLQSPLCTCTPPTSIPFASILRVQSFLSWSPFQSSDGLLSSLVLASEVSYQSSCCLLRLHPNPCLLCWLPLGKTAANGYRVWIANHF